MSWKKGNKKDGRHYWLTPPDLYNSLNQEFNFDYDPCPYPKPPGYDGLTAEWGLRNYVNPPFGMINDQGKKVGPLAWVKKCIQECEKGKLSVLIFTHYKWEIVLTVYLCPENARDLGNVRWCSTEDGKPGKGAGPTGLYVFRPMVPLVECCPTPVLPGEIVHKQTSIEFPI